MVKVATKPLKKQQQDTEDQIGDIFTALGQDTPAPRKSTEDKPIVDVQALQEQITQLNTRLDDQRRQMLQTYTTPVAVDPVIQEPKPVSFENMPDPVTDPVGYANEMNKRITVQWEDKQRANEQRQQVASRQNGAVESLWEDFQHAYPEFAHNEDRLDYIATKVARKMTARGVDMQKYMHGARDAFMEDVVSEYEKVFGPPEAQEHTETAVQRSPQRRNRSQVTEPLDEDDGRTGGIFGGAESGYKPDLSKDKPGDMVADIRALQRASGLF